MLFTYTSAITKSRGVILHLGELIVESLIWMGEPLLIVRSNTALVCQLQQYSSSPVQQTSKSLMPKFSRPSMLCDSSEINHTALIKRQPCADIYTDMH